MKLNSGNNFFRAQTRKAQQDAQDQQDASKQQSKSSSSSSKSGSGYDLISTNSNIFTATTANTIKSNCKTPTPTPPSCSPTPPTPTPPHTPPPTTPVPTPPHTPPPTTPVPTPPHTPPPTTPVPCPPPPTPVPTPPHAPPPPPTTPVPTPPPPTPVPCPPPPPPVSPPPPPAAVKRQGSLNISGDPTLTTTTPDVASTSMSFNEPVGKNFNVLTDPDSNFSMNVNLHTINPQGKEGIEQASFTAGGHAIQFANDGSLMVDGVNKGTLANGVSSIDLGNGITAGTAQMDDGGGKTATRFVLNTPDYQVTAALRQPTGAGAYYDVNIAENKDSAADNATGDKITGQTVSVADLLKKEPTA